MKSPFSLGVSLLVALGVVSALTATIPGSFTQIDCEGAGWFEQVIPTATGRLYGRTDVGGLYRSDNHGDSWQFLSGDMADSASYHVQGVAVSSADPDVVYQCTSTSYSDITSPGVGIWKSTDGGTSWTRVLAAVRFSGNDKPRFGGECIVIAPDNDHEVWAGTRGDGLWHSTDAGAHWTNVATATFDTPNIIVCGLTVHPAAPDQLWVCGEGGLWVSVNRGITWTKKLTATRIYRVVRQPDGTTFAAGVNETGSTTTNVLYRITATDWSNPATYTFTDIYANYLKALPWKPSDDLATVQVMANGDVWAADLFEFTAKSTNNGTTFTQVPMTLTGPIPAWQDPATTTVEGGHNSIIQDPTNPNRLYMGGGYAPFRSDDYGATWHYIAAGVGESCAFRAVFDPADHNRVWLPIADLGLTTVADAGISGLSTGYISWHFPWPDDNVVFTRRPLVSPGKVLAPGGKQENDTPRLYQSLDRGATWTKLPIAGLPTASGTAILDAVDSADNPDDFIVHCGGTTGPGQGGVYRTINGGQSFTQATGLPAGADGGDEWTPTVTLARDATAPALRYLMFYGVGLFKSTDRGASWALTAAQPRTSKAQVRVDPLTGRLWLGNEYSKGFDTSDDGAATISPFTGFALVTDFDCYAGRLVVYGRRSGDTFDKIYYSPNNGVAWDEITRPGYRFCKTSAVAIDPWRAGTVWISTGGRSIARFTPWTPLEIWTNAHFGSPLPTGDAAPTADPDADGLSNLVEYAIGTDPKVASPAPTAEIVTDAGSRYFALHVARDARHADLSYTVEASADLQTWTSADLVTLADTATLLSVRDAIPLDTGTDMRRFFRLRISVSAVSTP